MVHKEHACHHSPVLNAAFNSPMIEGQTQTYTFEDTSQEAVQYLVQWLYSQQIHVGCLKEWVDNGDEEDE